MRLEEAGAGLLEERRGERRRRGEAQFAAQLRLQQFDLLPRRAQRFQGLTSRLQVDLPGLGQRQAAGGALEQAGTEFRFQVGDGLGQRRGRLAQALGATAEATEFRQWRRTSPGHSICPSTPSAPAQVLCVAPGSAGPALWLVSPCPGHATQDQEAKETTMKQRIPTLLAGACLAIPCTPRRRRPAGGQRQDLHRQSAATLRRGPGGGGRADPRRSATRPGCAPWPMATARSSISAASA